MYVLTPKSSDDDVSVIFVDMYSLLFFLKENCDDTNMQRCDLDYNEHVY